MTDGDFSRLVPAIAKVVGWVEMKNIAVEDGFGGPAIENHQLNHPNDTGEQTVALLMDWEQKHGKEAAEKLVSSLLKNNKTSIVEKVVDIYKSDRKWQK